MVICARSRYDAIKHRQYKTVEIVVSESEWAPPSAKHPDGARVPLNIGIKETTFREQVRAVGGRWDREEKLWFVPYGCIAGTKLEKFIAVETSADSNQILNATYTESYKSTNQLPEA